MIKQLSTLWLSLSAVPPLAATTQYNIVFEGRWTPDLPLVGSSHFTTWAGATHNADGSLLAVGQPASNGVEQVAERGSTNALRTEVLQQIAAGNADQFVLGSDPFIGPEETDTLTITVDDQFPLLTLISMIAPTPDWFLGVHDLSLVDDQGAFIRRLVIDLPSYDAGTEDGQRLTLNNLPSDPQGVIQPLDLAEPNGALAGAGSIGRLTITQVPEPGTLFGIGLVGLALVSRRRRPSNA